MSVVARLKGDVKGACDTPNLFFSQSLLESTTPAGSQSGQARGAFVFRARAADMAQAKHLAHAHRTGGALDPLDSIAGCYPAFFQHAQIKAGAIRRRETRGKIFFSHANAQLETGRARLRYLYPRLSNLKHISDTNPVFQQARGREILPELSVGKIMTPQFPGPEGVVLERIHVHGLVRPAVHPQVRLAVAREIQASQPHRTGDRGLENAGGNRLAAMKNFTRQPYIDGNQGHVNP